MASVQDTDQPPKRKSLEQLDIPGSNQHQVERNRKRTKYVRFLRVFLPILGALVVLGIFIMQDRNEFADIRPIEEVAPQQMGENELLSPRFEAVDQNSQPYTLTAERAFQSPDNMDLITLEQPTADMRMSDGANFSLKSVGGLYNQNDQILDLSGDVMLDHDAGYTLRTNTLKLNVRDNTASTSDAVEADGPDAHIQASGLDADGKSSVLIFKGPAKLTLDNLNNEDEGE